jgi:hypothetical protein
MVSTTNMLVFLNEPQLKQEVEYALLSFWQVYTQNHVGFHACVAKILMGSHLSFQVLVISYNFGSSSLQGLLKEGYNLS